MFEPTNEQIEKWINPAYEDISMILTQLNDEIKCGNEYLIDLLKKITTEKEATKAILDREGIEN